MSLTAGSILLGGELNYLALTYLSHPVPLEHEGVALVSWTMYAVAVVTVTGDK